MYASAGHGGSVVWICDSTWTWMRRLAGNVAGCPQTGRSVTCYLAAQKQKFMDLIYDAPADLTKRYAA
eukprot:9479017-Pyramimonas_sp.AAC.1